MIKSLLIFLAGLLVGAVAWPALSACLFSRTEATRSLVALRDLNIAVQCYALDSQKESPHTPLKSIPGILELEAKGYVEPRLADAVLHGKGVYVLYFTPDHRPGDVFGECYVDGKVARLTWEEGGGVFPQERGHEKARKAAAGSR